MALTCKDHPAVLIDAPSFLVNKETLVGYHHTRLAVYVIEVTHHVVWVKVKLLNTEGCRHLATLVHVSCREHDFMLHIFQNVTCLGISQVTTLVSRKPLPIFVVSLGICKHDNVAFLVAVEVSQNVILIEETSLSQWWHLNDRICLASELLDCCVVNLYLSDVGSCTNLLFVLG